MLRRRVFALWALRTVGRLLVHLYPGLLGYVSEGYLGEFLIRPFGLRIKYKVGEMDSVGNLLLWAGPRHFEPGVLKTFKDHARSARSVLDIGANTGFYSLLACAANPKAKVIAWEPVPHLFDKLKVNVHLNAFGERCELRPNALSNRSGVFSMYVPGDSTMASLSPRYTIGPTKEISVNVETVDEAIDASMQVDLVKIDVEGFEYEALCGMAKTLARCQPTIIFECLPVTPAEPIEDLLHAHGYELHLITEKGVVPIAEIGDRSLGTNFLARQPQGGRIRQVSRA